MGVSEKRDQLFEVVEAQHGVFTTKQAVDAGYDRNTHAYQVRSGYWIRECRGIYRLAHYHYDEESEFVIWSLWTRDREEHVQGVYSHATALAMFDLSDLNPSKLHITVSRSFRKNCIIPSHLVFHTGELSVDDIEARQGYSLTTPIRTIADLCREESLDRDIIGQAISQAIQRGFISQRERKGALSSSSFPEWAKDIFKKG